MEILHTVPTAASFTSLSTHQSQTPESFFDGPPVLYHHSPSATLKTHASDLATAPALSSLAAGAHPRANGIATVNDDAADEAQDEELEIQNVDIWVTSERLILYSAPQTTGISIPYPTISLHAMQSHPPSLILQLQPTAQTFDDHDPDATISLTIIPSPPPTTTTETAPSTSPSTTLYAALSACANLHPDPLSASETSADENTAQNAAIRFETSTDINPPAAEGGTTALPPPMPGSGGWITAENVGEFFDEDGNWWGGEEWTESEVLGVPGAGLGEGAGSVRGREEEEGDETKWRRTG